MVDNKIVVCVLVTFTHTQRMTFARLGMLTATYTYRKNGNQTRFLVEFFSDLLRKRSASRDQLQPVEISK